MSTPADQLPMQQPPASPLDQYMATYGQQLQSMLANDPNQGAAPPANDPAMAAAGQVSDLGPDNYRPQLPQVPQQSALAAPQGQGAGSAAPQGQTPAGPPQSALAGGQGSQGAPAADGSTGDGKDQGLSFRDLFKQQSQATRDKYVQQLQDHLKQANQTIDSAYQDMMEKMGGRPDKDLSKQQKGMLLMEFGMRMMEHSRGQYGQTNAVGGAIGQAGTETLQSAKGMIASNTQNQQRYDQMQEQLAIAQGKEKSQLASRSALESGRDIRAFGQQDSLLARTQMQQQGADTRNTERVTATNERAANAEQGKNDRAAAAAGQVKRTVTGDDGSIYGVTGNGSLVQLGKNGTPIKASATGGPGGGKLTAAQANYNLYVSTYGKDQDGKPLTGQDLQAVQSEALKYAANPRTYQLSDAQAKQMAEKSADSFIRANPTSWLGMSTDEVASKHDEYAEQEYNRIRRGAPAIATPPPGPRSALEGSGTAPRPNPATSGNTPPAAPATPPAKAGAIPTSPPPNIPRGPNAAQLDALQKDPQHMAPYFLQKFGYLPREFHQYAQSPLSH